MALSMEYLKMKINMQSEMGFWEQIFLWVKENTIALGSIGLGWKAIDRGFKYLSDGREKELRRIVTEELGKEIQPEIKKLSTSIDELKESIWALKKP